MPLQRRVPKFGFKSLNRIEYKAVNLDALQKLSDEFKVEEITINTLIEHGLANTKDRIKILGRGKLTSKVNVEAHGFSEAAKKAIEANGGEVKTV
jgi:large subunit ribosomal protein L15